MTIMYSYFYILSVKIVLWSVIVEIVLRYFNDCTLPAEVRQFQALN